MRFAAMLALTIAASIPAQARCVITRLPAVLCRGADYAGQFGKVARDSKRPPAGAENDRWIDPNGCTVVRTPGVEVFPTGSRFRVMTWDGERVEVARIELDGVPPMMIASEYLGGSCRR